MTGGRRREKRGAARQREGKVASRDRLAIELLGIDGESDLETCICIHICMYECMYVCVCVCVCAVTGVKCSVVLLLLLLLRQYTSEVGSSRPVDGVVRRCVVCRVGRGLLVGEVSCLAAFSMAGR